MCDLCVSFPPKHLGLSYLNTVLVSSQTFFCLFVPYLFSTRDKIYCFCRNAGKKINQPCPCSLTLSNKQLLKMGVLGSWERGCLGVRVLPETSGEQRDFTDLEASLCKLACQIVLDSPSASTECVCARHGFHSFHPGA